MFEEGSTGARYVKKAVKKTPRKADHAHDYIRVEAVEFNRIKNEETA